MARIARKKAVTASSKPKAVIVAGGRGNQRGVVGYTGKAIKTRSLVTNGTRMLPGVHMNCAWARRQRDLLELHLADLGGPDNCSEAEKALVRRASTLIVELEQMECHFAVDGSSPKALDVYQRLTNTLRRTLESLGIKRRAKDVTPTLGQLLANDAVA